jgi:hypothetical protein
VQLDDGHHHGGATGVSTMSDHEATTKNGDSKTLRRLAQNREAARKSRLRKKVGFNLVYSQKKTKCIFLFCALLTATIFISV